MDDTSLNGLVGEVREDYQIPPYFPDTTLQNSIKEGEFALSKLNSGCDISKDLSYRQLLKNYTYYAIHHRVDEFFKNYSEMILTWQLETEVPANASTENT